MRDYWLAQFTVEEIVQMAGAIWPDKGRPDPDYRPRRGCRDDVSNDETPALAGASRGADEGTRTLDLLHGKQTL